MEASVSCIKTGREEKKSMGLNGMEDRISALTNDILVDILSLLDTKYVIRTSVLSTRWKSVWASVPVLNFDDRFNGSNEFMKFVDRVFLLHDLPFLYKFSLCCDMHDPYRINAWVSTALTRKVQELDLCIEEADLLPLPRSLFISDTLTVLKINSPSDFAVTKIPTTVCLPNLKDLCLCSLKFSTHEPNQRVSFSFPMLKKFELHNCQWIGIASVEIVAPSLETLIFHDFFDRHKAQKIKVYAESLKSLKFISRLSYYLILCNLNSLAKAFIYVNDYLDTDYDYMTNMFRVISKVKRLTISGFLLKFICQAENQPLLLNFSSLIHFKVDVGLSDYFEEDLQTVSSEKLIDILYLLPTIQYFQFNNDSVECGLHDSGDEPNKVVPQDSLAHLKLVKLKNFHGSKNELDFVKDLLNNARALNEISITSNSKLLKDSKEHMEIAKKLQILPRDSNCLICFS